MLGNALEVIAEAASSDEDAGLNDRCSGVSEGGDGIGDGGGKVLGIDGDRTAGDRAIDTDDRGVDEIPGDLDVAGTLSGEHRVDDTVDLTRCNARVGEDGLRDREVLVDAQLGIEALHPVVEHRVARSLGHAG